MLYLKPIQFGELLNNHCLKDETLAQETRLTLVSVLKITNFFVESGDRVAKQHFEYKFCCTKVKALRVPLIQHIYKLTNFITIG